MTKALVPLAQGCEEMEAVTIIDILRRAGIEVVTAGLEEGIVVASRGMRLLPDTTLGLLSEHAWDLVALPGGLPGADHLAADARLLNILHATLKAGGVLAAICAAPKVLAQEGLLNGKRATAYPGAVDWEACPRANCTGAAVEIDGNIITSRGPGTALDFALALVEKLKGQTVRADVEARLVREMPEI